MKQPNKTVDTRGNKYQERETGLEHAQWVYEQGFKTENLVPN